MSETSQKDYILTKAKPFLKWAGGKKWLMPLIRNFLPINFNKYYEPFLGSGSLFFTIGNTRSVLSDINVNLVNTYVALRDCHPQVIRKLKSMPYNEKYYYHTRNQYSPKSLANKAQNLFI